MPSSVSLELSQNDSPLLHIYEFLRNDSSSSDAANDYSSSPEVFSAGPSGDEMWCLTSLSVLIQGQMGPMYSPSKYGNIAAVANGITVAVETAGGGVLDLLDTETIKTNLDWFLFSSFNFVQDEPFLGIHIPLLKSLRPLPLRGVDGQFLSVSLQDDFSDLVAHKFFVQGFKQPHQT